MIPTARTMPISGHGRRDPGPQGRRSDERADDALTNLSAYAMTLDAEYHRLDDRFAELANTESGVAAFRAVVRERDEVAAEREAFRRAVAALRELVSEAPESSR